MAKGSREFERLQDTRQMRALLGEHLRWADGGRVEVVSCSVGHARQATGRLLLHYDVVVRNPATGLEQPEMVTGIATDRRKAAHFWDDATGVEAPVLPGRIVPLVQVPELDLLLQVFPFDYRLPALAQLVTDPATLIAPHIPARTGASQGLEPTWEAEVVRYRVGMRAMVRLTAAGSATGATGSPPRIYAKVFRDESDGQRTFDVQRAIWEETTAGNAAFAVARPLAWLSGARVLLYGEVPGVSLRNILSSTEPAEAAVRQAARAIAGFHQLPVEIFEGSPRRRPTRDEEARPAKLGERLRLSVPHLAPEIDRVVTGIETRLCDAPSAPTHFDLRPGHVLLDGDHVALLDFDKLTLADPMIDVANFLTLLEKDWKSSKTHPGQQARLPQVFREEYFARVPGQWAERMPTHYALAILSQAEETARKRAGRSAQAKRKSPVENLIRRAEEALAGTIA